MDNAKLPVADSKPYIAEIADRKMALDLYPTTVANVKLCSDQVTLNNKLLKEMKEKRANAVLPYLTALNEAMRPIDDVIEEFEKQAGDYQKANLANKKESKRQERREVYSSIITNLMNDGVFDGEAPSFEEVDDDAYYSKPKSDVRDLFYAKLMKSVKKDEKGFFTFTVYTKGDAEKVRKFLIEGKIHHDEDKL